MRALLLVLAGCGRLGFGAPSGDGGDGTTGDGPDANDIVVTLAATGNCPAIAWNGTELAVTWRDNGSVWFAETDAMGAIVGAPAPLVGSLSNLDCPTVAWSGTHWLVAYSSGALNKGDIDIIAPGAAPQNVVTDSGDSTAPQLCGDGNGAVVAWLDQTGTNYNVFTRAIDATGTPIGSVQTPSANDGSSPGVAFTGTDFAVLWAGGTSLHMRRVSTAGAIVSADAPFATTDAVNPVAVAWSGADLVVSWRDFIPDQFFVAREDLAGTLTMMPTALDPAAVRARSIVWTGAGFAMLWLDMAGLVEYNFGRLDGNGAFLSREEVLLPHPDTTSPTSLAWTGARYLAALESNGGGVTLRSFVRP